MTKPVIISMKWSTYICIITGTDGRILQLSNPKDPLRRIGAAPLSSSSSFSSSSAGAPASCVQAAIPHLRVSSPRRPLPVGWTIDWYHSTWYRRDNAFDKSAHPLIGHDPSVYSIVLPPSASCTLQRPYQRPRSLAPYLQPISRTNRKVLRFHLTRARQRPTSCRPTVYRQHQRRSRR